MVDPVATYGLIYALAARDGRDRVLFGRMTQAAREAFCRGLCSVPVFPELWFELPLAGDPWFDLHMLVSAQDMCEGVAFAGLGGGYAKALSWFARADSVRQLALSFDTGVGNVEHPAIQLLVGNKGAAIAEGFLAAAGRADLAPAWHAFVKRIPEPWFACYVGVFPQRAGDESAVPWVRVECIVGEKCQCAYAQDADVLRDHLARVSMTEFDATLVPRIQQLARSPFPLELQFNVGPDGTALPALSASLRFGPEAWRTPDAPDGVHTVFRQAQEWGLADGRWRQLVHTAFAKRMSHGGDAATLCCYPAFIKYRWREGMAPDAKTYLIAGVA